MCSVGAILGSYGKSPSLYDACDAVEATLSKKLSDPEACLADLKAHYLSDPLPGSDGYSSAVNVYKSENGLGISANAVTNSTCGENEAFSPRFGGVCVSCGTGEIEYSAVTSQLPPLAAMGLASRLDALVGADLEAGVKEPKGRRCGRWRGRSDRRHGVWRRTSNLHKLAPSLCNSFELYMGSGR